MLCHPQIEMRKRTASPQRLVLRLIMFDLSQGFFKKLAESFDDLTSEEQQFRKAQTFELPLTEEQQETTAGTALDAASIRSLRSMFLLLNEWDRALQSSQKEGSSGEINIEIRLTPNGYVT